MSMIIESRIASFHHEHNVGSLSLGMLLQDFLEERSGSIEETKWFINHCTELAERVLASKCFNMLNNYSAIAMSICSTCH
jgi:hypothetical protein